MSNIVLEGKLNKVTLPATNVVAINNAYDYYKEQTPDALEALLKLGVTLEGVTGLLPFTYNGVTVFIKWNGDGPSLDVYAVGTGGSPYVLLTFKSTDPTPYQLDSRDQTLRVVSVPRP